MDYDYDDDIDRLRAELTDYFGTMMQELPASGLSGLLNLESASDAEVIQMAREYGIK